MASLWTPPVCGRGRRPDRPNGCEPRLGPPGVTWRLPAPVPVGPLRVEAEVVVASAAQDPPDGAAAARPSSKKATTASASGRSTAGRDAPKGAFQNAPSRGCQGPT